MRIVFIGSKDLGCLCLEELIRRNDDIVGVIARHDDPHPGMWYNSATEISKKKGLKLFKPKDINDPVFAEEIKKIKPDVIFVVFYPQILKKHFIDIPPRGCINLHFAPLPKYRGCMPGTWAIIEGAKEFGVTMHYIDKGVDSGDIIAQSLFEIKNGDTGFDLYKRCEEKGLELFKKTFPLIKKGNAPREPQDKSKVIYHKRGLPNDRYVEWDSASSDIYNFIRALTFPHFPAPRTILDGKEILITKSEIVKKVRPKTGNTPGEILEILSCDKYVIATKDGNIIIRTDGKIKLKKGDKLSGKSPAQQESLKK